jgi:hypothetical protein
MKNRDRKYFTWVISADEFLYTITQLTIMPQILKSLMKPFRDLQDTLPLHPSVNEFIARLRGDNPGVPTREFWADIYPDVEAYYVSEYGDVVGPEIARAVTADIWHNKLSARKKKRYEQIRERREK